MPSATPELCREIVMQSALGIWVCDGSLGLTYLNPTMAAMLGRPAAQLLGRPLVEFLDPADAGTALATLQSRHLETRRAEWRFRRADGSVLWAEVAFTPRAAAPAGPGGFCGFCIDSTQRRHTEHALYLSEQRYRTLLAAATDYVFTVPYEDGRPGLTTHGAGCVKVTGYEPADYAADPYLWYRMIAVDDRAQVEAHIRRANEGTAADTIEHRLLHRDGTVRWVRSTLVARREPTGRLLAIDGIVTDITERTLALQQLRERETLYRALMESATDGFLIAEPSGRIIEANEVYVRRSGFTRAELLATNLTALDSAPAAETATRLDRAVREGHDLSESRHHAHDGTTWPVDVSMVFWPIGTGRLFIFVRDIQSRKRSELLLRTRLRLTELSRSREVDPLLQAALDDAEMITGSSIGFFHFVDADQEHLTLHAWSSNTLRHHCNAEGKGRHYPISQAGIWTDCVRQRVPIVHNDYASAPGRRGLPPGHAPVLRELNVPILRDERVVAIIGVGNKPTDYGQEDIDAVHDVADVAMDIVQRLQAEQMLRRNEHQLRLIIDSVPALIAYIDTDFRYRLVNQAYAQWFGDPLESIVGRSVAEQIGPAAWAEVKEVFTHALAGETVSYERELHLRNAGRRWVHGTYTPDRDPGGKVHGIVVLVSDITPQKELEQQLLRAQRLEVVGRLASGVAHDLNNILQPVLMAPRLLRPAIADPEALELINTVEVSVRRGAEIIKQLLAFGRGATVRRVPLRLDTLLADLARILRETLPKNIVLRCEVPPHAELVQADATQLHQVLMNLCLNARDAMRTGGTLAIQLTSAEFGQTPHDAIPAGRTGRFQRISVTDTGTGIAPENLPRLFDPFFTTKDVGEGTGLGLATVLGIVRSHDGFLRVETRLGAGSTFEVYLPVATTGATPGHVAAPRDPAPALDGRQRHVLIVDDEAPVRTLIRQTLQLQDFRISEAPNGAEALHLLAAHPAGFDLVLADLLMPVMDGPSLIDELHRRTPALPIIAISGHLGAQQLPSVTRSAIRALLQKPFDSNELLAAITRALA